MRQLLPHLIRNSDLFCNYDVKNLTGVGNIKRKYKCSDKKALVSRIFLRYLHILFSDMVEGGKIFAFPSPMRTKLQVARLKRQHFITARKRGAYTKVDVLASNFNCYELVMTYMSKGNMITIPVKMSNNYKERMVEKMNEGYVYC